MTVIISCVRSCLMFVSAGSVIYYLLKLFFWLTLWNLLKCWFRSWWWKHTHWRWLTLTLFENVWGKFDFEIKFLRAGNQSYTTPHFTSFCDVRSALISEFGIPDRLLTLYCILIKFITFNVKWKGIFRNTYKGDQSTFLFNNWCVITRFQRLKFC